MAEPKTRQTLQIKKYPNRRFYDTTRSRHVTLQELHEAVVEGHTLVVADSKTGEDITNVILVQILLEKDPPKLHLFPSWILHSMVRSKPSAFRGAMDHLIRPITGPMAATQRQMDELMNRALAGEFINPLEWTQALMRAFTSPPASPEPDAADAPPKVENEPPDSEDALNDLRKQVAALNKRMEKLQKRS